MLIHSASYDAVLFAINECTNATVLSDSLRSLSMDPEEQRSILDPLFILLDRLHASTLLSAILSLLSALPTSTVFSFLSKLPCDHDTLEWIIEQLSVMQWNNATTLTFVIVFCCKLIDTMKLNKSFRLLEIKATEISMNTLINPIIRRLEEISMNRDIPYIDAFLVYLFHGNQPPPASYSSLLRRFLALGHIQLMYRLIEVASEEKKEWQFREICGDISEIPKIPSELFIQLLIYCTIEDCINDFIVKWLLREGAAVVSYCMREPLPYSTLERLSLHLLEWSLTAPLSGVSEDEEKLMAMMIRNSEVMLRTLKEIIPVTSINDSHFSELLHTIIQLVGSDPNYFPLVFLTAHDHRFHSALLIQSCHSLIEDCLDFQNQSLGTFYRNVSISAVFMLLMGIKNRTAISKLFLAMLVESGIPERDHVLEIKSLLLPQPVLIDLFQYSQHPLILLYLFEYLETSHLDLSTYSKVVLDVLSHPIVPIEFNELFEQDRSLLNDVKEFYHINWNVIE